MRCSPGTGRRRSPARACSVGPRARQRRPTSPARTPATIWSGICRRRSGRRSPTRELEAARAELLLDGIEVLPAKAYLRIPAFARLAARHGYPVLR